MLACMAEFSAEEVAEVTSTEGSLMGLTPVNFDDHDSGTEIDSETCRIMQSNLAARV